MLGKGKEGMATAEPMRMLHKDVVIVGSGPTGLGAAARLHQHDVNARRGSGASTSWMLLDAAPEAGGLACTDITKEGFLFDMVRDRHIYISETHTHDDDEKHTHTCMHVHISTS